MDYEKKYKEALRRAKTLIEKLESNHIKGFIYDIFPELQENEDERIRKELIFYLGDMPEDTELRNGVTNRDVLVWLEKQGVQPRYNIGDAICDKSCTTLNKEAQPNMEIVDIKNDMYICDKGSFPVSQQDEYELVSKKIDTKLNDDSVSNELRAASTAHARKEIKNPTFPGNEEFELAYTFEEGAKWQAAQKHTLSKEDEGILDEIIDFFENGTVKLQHDLSLYASWVKSLKGRVGCEANCTTTKKWKPSDEQMAALNNAILLNEDHYNGAVLSTLREQLMKLK